MMLGLRSRCFVTAAAVALLAASPSLSFAAENAKAKPQATAKTEAAKPKAVAKKAETVTAPAVAAAISAPAKASDETAAADSNGVIATVSLLPPEPVRFAAFVREGFLWMVFDGWVSSIAPEAKGVGASAVGEPQRFAVGEATAYRFAVPKESRPIVRKEGLTWHVDLTREPAGRQRTAVEPVNENGKISLSIPIHAPSVPLKLRDPLIGDELVVVASEKAGEGRGIGRNLLDFDQLESAQGLVLLPRNDALKIDRTPVGVKISAPQGLRASEGLLAASMNAEVSAEPPLEGAIFQIKRWRREGVDAFLAKRREIEARAATAEGPDLVRARLDLARMHFAHGFAREANGLIGLVVQQMPEFETSPDLRALRGAVRVLNFELDKGMEDLSVPALTNQAEASLWRGLAAAYRGDWRKAYEDFRRGRAILDSYPNELYAPLALARLEAVLRQGNGSVAGTFIEEMEKRRPFTPGDEAALAYLKGEYKRQVGEPETAKKIWEELIAGEDQLHRVKSELALIDLGVEEKNIDKKQAVEKLDGMRFAWRGDALELAVLRKLGALQMETGAYRDGFTTLRYAAGLIAGSPLADTITAELSSRFNALFVEDQAQPEPLSAVEAYALFQDFSELNPVGPAGDRAVERLADRLVSIDLLDKAAEVLQRQVGFRLTGAEKGRVGAKLAGVRLLDNDPNGALKALSETDVPELNDAQKLERRLLQARALAMLQKPDEALALIANLPGEDAARLKADTLWRAQRWAEAAQAIEGLIGPLPSEPPMPAEKARLIVDRAVALTLAGDKAAISQLPSVYGGLMLGNDEEPIFALLTGPQALTGLPDLETIRSRIGAVDLFKKFMDSYRSAPRAGDAKPVAAAAATEGSG
jgi:hypothetical protein